MDIYEGKVNDSFLNKILRILTSSFIFITTFILSNLILKLVIAAIARTLKYNVKFSYNHILAFPRDYHFWSVARVALVYALSPVTCFIAGIILFSLLSADSTFVSRLRVFVFWLMICLVNICLGHLLFSSLGKPGSEMGFYQTFSNLWAWLYFNSGIMVFFSIVAIIVSILWGLLVAQEIMRFSFSSRLIRTESGRNSFLLQAYVFPVLIGMVPLLFLSSKLNFFPTLVVFVNLLLIGVGMFIRNVNGFPNIKPFKGDLLNHFPIVELVVCAVTWFAVFRFFMR